MRRAKEVAGVYGPGGTYWVGDGFPVRNLFPSNPVAAQVNPFLLLDYAGPASFPPSRAPRGVEQHPHRGFETVTIAYQGSVDHRDSAGHSGSIDPGDVQWMTAASGVVHEEKHGARFTETGGVFELVQLWVNLPARYKMSVPRYQAISSGSIPVAGLGPGAHARIIAGELNGVAGAARTFTPLNVFDARMQRGASAVFTFPTGHNAALALLRGDLAINSETALQGEARLAILSSAGEAISIDAREDSVCLVLSGEPIDEPVASRGPFVMNTEQELRQAMDDYRSGKMGRL